MELVKQDYITVVRPVGAGTLDSTGRPMIEDDYGELTVTTEETISTFWGNVKELKSNLQTQAGAILQTRRLEITADSRDTEAVDIGDVVTINNLDNNQFVVMNQYESDWRWHRTLLVEFTNR